MGSLPYPPVRNARGSAICRFTPFFQALTSIWHIRHSVSTIALKYHLPTLALPRSCSGRGVGALVSFLALRATMRAL